MKTVALAVLAAVSLAPAALAQTAAPAAAPAAAAKFNLDTPIQTIVADDKAKAALESVIPGLSAHESYEMFKGMSLNQLAGYAGDKLTPDVLAKAQAALAEVK
jgi:hypothetical protein